MTKFISKESSVLLIYILVVANYVSFALYIWSVRDGSAANDIIFVAYFILLVFMHIVNIRDLDLDLKIALKLWEMGELEENVMNWTLLAPFVFFNDLDKLLWGYDINERILARMTHYTKKYHVAFLIIKILLLTIFYTCAGIFIKIDTWYHITTTVTSSVLLTFLSFASIPTIRIIYEWCSFIFLCFAFLLCIVIVIVFVVVPFLIVLWSVKLMQYVDDSKSSGGLY